MKQNPWKNNLLTLFLFILLLGIETPVSRQNPEEASPPFQEYPLETEVSSDENYICPLSDLDKPRTKIDTYSF